MQSIVPYLLCGTMLFTNTMWNEIINFIKSPEVLDALGGALLAFGTLFIKRFRTWLLTVGAEKQHGITRKTVQGDSVIDEELSAIRSIAKAARVAVWQVHNGATFSYSNERFVFMSTYEVCNDGVASDQTVISETQVTRCPDIFLPSVDPSLAAKYPGVTNITPKDIINLEIPTLLRLDRDELIYNNSWTKAFMDQNGSELMYIIPLFANKGVGLMGLLTIQYLKNDATKKECEKHIYDIFASASRIQFYLDKTKR